jgi:hypothetical protein
MLLVRGAPGAAAPSVVRGAPIRYGHPVPPGKTTTAASRCIAYPRMDNPPKALRRADNRYS